MGKYTSFLGKKLPVAALVAVLLGCGNMAEAAARDNFYWLGQINKATAVINTEEHLLTP